MLRKKFPLLALILLLLFVFQKNSSAYQIINSTFSSDMVTYDFFAKSTCGGQFCNDVFPAIFESPGGFLQVQYFVPNEDWARHCSPIRIDMFLDDVFIYQTEWLGWYGATGEFGSFPLQTPNLQFGYVSKGAHVLSLQGQGQIGGCNFGELNSWGGHLEIKLSPVPEPATMLLLASGLVGLAGLRKKFR